MMMYFFLSLIVLLMAIISAEMMFRKRSVKKYGKIYEPVGKATLTDYVKKYRPYPYLPYLMHPAPEGTTEQPDTRRFAVPGTTTRAFAINEAGLFDVVNKSKVSVTPGEKVVLLAGSSALEGIMYMNGEFISIGALLQQKLNKFAPGKYRVVTMAMAGWLSSEILIYAQLKYLDLKPEYLVYYHGANDVLAAVSPGFTSDYSHYRRSIAEVFPTIKSKLTVSGFFPYLPAFTLYEFLLRKAGLRFHPVYELSKLLRPNQPSLKLTDSLQEHLEAEKRNVKNLFASAISSGVKIIGVPYQYWVYDSNSQWLNVQRKGVDIENKNLEELCTQFNVLFIKKAETELLKNEQHFVDEQHYSVQGMEEFSELILDVIRNEKV